MRLVSISCRPDPLFGWRGRRQAAHRVHREAPPSRHSLDVRSVHRVRVGSARARDNTEVDRVARPSGCSVNCGYIYYFVNFRNVVRKWFAKGHIYWRKIQHSFWKIKYKLQRFFAGSSRTRRSVETTLVLCKICFYLISKTTRLLLSLYLDFGIQRELDPARELLGRFDFRFWWITPFVDTHRGYRMFRCCEMSCCCVFKIMLYCIVCIFSQL